MFSKALSHLSAVLFPQVPGCNRRDLTDGINRVNVARAKITAAAFVFLELLLLAVSFAVRKDDMLIPPGRYYLWMYLTMLSAMLGFYIFFGKMQKNVERRAREIGVGGIFFTSFILCWCAGISLLDQIYSGQILVYVFAAVAVSVTPFFKPVTLLLMYLPIQAAFVVLLIKIPQPFGFPFGNIVNSTAFLVISWFISFMRYRAYVIEFSHAKLIEEKNTELNRINIRLQEANRKLEILSRTDSLTGVSNRSMFDFMIKVEWDRCRRSFAPLSLVMIDIDFFKDFNDHYGHPAGDLCLRKVAEALSGCAKRASDTVARYGGEEFAVILPMMDQAGAKKLAEQIRDAVEKLAIPHAFSRVSKHVTISLGVYTGIPDGDTPIEQFVANADRALYDAKRDRNKVVVS